MNRKIFNKIYNKICLRRLKKLLPTLSEELKAYQSVSDTTGTQAITLWIAVNSIMRYQPKFILECGTGASTIVFSLAVEQLKLSHPTYSGRIISMESEKEWFDIARENLPEKHKMNVEIVFGPREKYEISMFRGYVHSNIPEYPYDFVFLDGPDFSDDNGATFCGDALYVMEKFGLQDLRGVIDGRASTAFVMQTLFGKNSTSYFLPSMAGSFHLMYKPKFKHFVTTDFTNAISGRLLLKNRR